MAQLVLKNIDAETAEKLEMRAKRLGTTPEEEAAQLLRERLRGEPHREPATTSAAAVKTPAFVTMANTLDPELASELADLQHELSKQREAFSKKTTDEQEIQHSGVDHRFIRKHGFLVFVGAVKTEEIPDHRVVRDERIAALLEGADEGRV